MSMNRDPVIERVADTVGGIVSLSLALGLSRGAVSQWKKVPAAWVLEIERMSGISRYELRPDVFGPSPKKRPSSPDQAVA